MLKAKSLEMSLIGSGIDTDLQVKDLLKDIYEDKICFELLGILNITRNKGRDRKEDWFESRAL